MKAKQSNDRHLKISHPNPYPKSKLIIFGLARLVWATGWLAGADDQFWDEVNGLP